MRKLVGAVLLLATVWAERTRDTLTVGSSGPGGRRGTDDDITHDLPY